MAIYRTISMSFWTDSKIVDDFTTEDKFFYLYLLTNPHTNLCGCYEISLTQMANETGYGKKTIENLLARFTNVHNVVRYSQKTKELLLLNWNKYNWTSSDKFRKPLMKEIDSIKETEYRTYLQALADGEDTGYPIDTNCMDITVTVTDTVTDTVTVSDTVPVTDTYTVIKAWNNLGLSQVTKYDSGSPRGKNLKKLISKYGLDSVLDGIDKVRESQFLTGSTGWRASFDWFVKPGNFIKVMEDQYKDNPIGLTPSQQVSTFHLWNGGIDDRAAVYDNCNGS